MERGRLSGLDGLRGIAALGVLSFHIWRVPGGNGYLAVDFFFLLSGYVMARSYEDRLRDGGSGAARAFMAARFWRLYPTLAIASLLGLPYLFARFGIAAVPIALATLLLVPVDGPDDPFTLNPPAWSILCELLANLAHALVFARLSTRNLAALTLALAGILTWQVLPRTLHVIPGEGDRLLCCVRVSVPYAMGILLYRTWRDRPPVTVPPLITWSAMPAWFLAGPLLIGPSGAADLVFLFAICPLLLAGGLAQRGESRWQAALGTLSFPLYAVHAPIVLTLRALGLGPLWQVPACLLAAAAMVPVSRYLVAHLPLRLARPRAGLAPG